jgi:hypothetical protein
MYPNWDFWYSHLATLYFSQPFHFSCHSAAIWAKLNPFTFHVVAIENETISGVDVMITIFSNFSWFLTEKIGVFLKNQCYDQSFENPCIILNKTPIFGENILKSLHRSKDHHSNFLGMYIAQTLYTSEWASDVELLCITKFVTKTWKMAFCLKWRSRLLYVYLTWLMYISLTPPPFLVTLPSKNHVRLCSSECYFTIA